MDEGRSVRNCDLQSLAVGGEARDTHEALLVDLEHTLEVAIDSHELRGESSISCDRHAVLAFHGNH